MGVVPDNTGQSSTALSATTLTIGSFAVGAGADRVIYLSVSQWKASDTQPTATFNGTELFVVHDSVTFVQSPGVRRITQFKLVNPSNVTANIVVTWATAVDEAVAGADSWSNVDQTAPFSAAVKNSGGVGSASSSINLAGAVGDVNHCAIAADSAASAGITANQTQRWRAIAGASTTEGAGQSSAGTGGNVTHTWSTINSPSGGFFAHIGVVIQQAASTGGAWVGGGSRRAPGQRGPYDQRGFLIRRQYDYTPSAVVAVTVLQRKTLSPVGTHTGGRQGRD